MTDEHTQMHENDSLIESFIPTDFTDVGQGTVLYDAYHHKLRYCEGVGWIAHITAAYGNRLKRRHIAIPSA